MSTLALYLGLVCVILIGLLLWPEADDAQIRITYQEGQEDQAERLRKIVATDYRERIRRVK